MTPSEIKRLRTRRGQSQEEFARDVGVSVFSVVRWETGKNRPAQLARRRLLQIAQQGKAVAAR